MIVAAAALGPLLSPYDPISTSRETFQAPSLAHPLGTDDLGRDVMTRVLYGGRVSLMVGLGAVLLGTLGGAALGVLSGYLGGAFDLLVQRVVDALLSFPAIVLSMSVVAVLGASSVNAMLAISLAMFPGQSRVIRSAVLALRQNMYVEAAVALGASPRRVMIRHITPNIVAPLLILASGVLGDAILIEAGLSFLGLSTQPPEPSWGLMLSGTGRRYMERAPWLALVPGLAISLSVLAFNLLGDVVRDVLDPRLRGSQ